MKTEFEHRHEDLTNMTADHATYEAAGNGRYAGILAAQISVLKHQLAHFNPQADHAAQFLDGHGYTAAMNAYGEIGYHEGQEIVLQEVVDTFHRGTITCPNIFSDIAAELVADGPNAALDVKGYTLRHDGEFLAMTAPTGECRSFPIPYIA